MNCNMNNAIFTKICKIVKNIAIAAAVLTIGYCIINDLEESNERQRSEHDKEIWEEAYSSGQYSVIDDPEKYIDISEYYSEGYKDGYLDGWNDCNDGVALEIQ